MKNLILFFGQEKLLIMEEILKIKQKVVPQHLESVNMVTFDGKTVSYEEITDACETVPMLTEKKLIVVYDARFFSKAGKEDEEKTDDFLKKLQTVPDHSILIFTAEKVDKRKKIYKLIKAHGVVREFKSLSIKDKAFWIKKRAEYYGKKIELKTAYYIAEHTKDLYQVDNELRKIASFVGNSKDISHDDVNNIFSKSLEGNIFEMMDFIGAKNIKAAIDSIDNLMKQGEAGIVILYMISKHLMNLISVKSMKNYSFQQLKEKSGLHPFVLKKVIKQSNNFSIDELKRCLKMCQQMDLDIKKGRINERTGLELLVSNMLFDLK